MSPFPCVPSTKSEHACESEKQEVPSTAFPIKLSPAVRRPCESHLNSDPRLSHSEVPQKRLQGPTPTSHPMSHLLWKYFFEDSVDKFRRRLAEPGPESQASAGSVTGGSFPGSRSSVGTSPRASAKQPKYPGLGHTLGTSKNVGSSLSRAQVNARDRTGLTILLHIASSTKSSAVDFARALLAHPGVDIYSRDAEHGWNALHLALYTGNISIARLLLEKEQRYITDGSLGASAGRVCRLIKTKDNDGNSPFDLYNGMMDQRLWRENQSSEGSVAESDGGESEESSESGRLVMSPTPDIRRQGMG